MTTAAVTLPTNTSPFRRAPQALRRTNRLPVSRLYGAAIFLTMTLLTASSPALAASPTAKLTADQRKQLAVFGMRAMGMAVDTNSFTKIPNAKETLEMVGTGLNLNGHLCAQIVTITPLKVAGGFEVTCIANRGGSARKSYVLESAAGKAVGL